jgi:hypothetical protein
MIEIQLSTEAAAVLKDALTGYLSDLRMEISATDLMDFREKLKHQEMILDKILNQLPKAPEGREAP